MKVSVSGQKPVRPREWSLIWQASGIGLRFSGVTVAVEGHP